MSGYGYIASLGVPWKKQRNANNIIGKKEAGSFHLSIWKLSSGFGHEQSRLWDEAGLKHKAEYFRTE